MLVALFFHVLESIGGLLLNIVYGRKWVKETKEKIPERYKRLSSLSFLVILIGIIAGAFIGSSTQFFGSGLIFDIVVFSLWTVFARRNLKKSKELLSQQESPVDLVE